MSVYIQAILLLIDRNLTWSQDLEAIRPTLCALFLAAEQNQTTEPLIQALAERICSDE